MDDQGDILGQAMHWMFTMRGVLDPTQAVPGLGASLSEAFALGQLTGGELTQRNLGDQLRLEKSTVSRLVSAMAAKGWVDSTPDPDNRRYRLVRLTPAGRRTATRVTAAMRDRHARVLAALTAHERQCLGVALRALRRTLGADITPD